MVAVTLNTSLYIHALALIIAWACFKAWKRGQKESIYGDVARAAKEFGPKNQFNFLQEDKVWQLTKGPRRLAK
jgi:hypothetical protein